MGEKNSERVKEIHADRKRQAGRRVKRWECWISRQKPLCPPLHTHTHTIKHKHTLTLRAVDAGVLVVTQEEAIIAVALVAAHGVHTHLLAAAIVVHTLVNIYKETDKDTHTNMQRY